MSKKPSAGRAYEMIKTLPVGSSFTVKDIMKKMPDYVTSSAVGNLVWRMSSKGYVNKIPGTRQYGVTDKTATFHKVHRFAGKYDIPESRQVPRGPRGPNKPSAVSDSDYDIIENLLTAMSAAEPILRRYEQLDKFVRTFNDLSNIK